MKKGLVALGGISVLWFLTSAASASDVGLPDPSGNGIVPTYGEIKNRNQCDGADFFKNIFPSLTNGGPGSSDFVDLTVQGTPVRVTVAWYPENYFDFDILGGYLTKLAVTADKNTYVYDYTGASALGANDTNLHIFTDESDIILTGDDVNHIDICIVAGAPNSAPVITGTPPASVEAGNLYVFENYASDVDGDTLSYSIDAPNELFNWASFNTSTGKLSGTPTNADAGLYENITITVLDDEASATVGPFSIEVTPTFTFDAQSCLELGEIGEDGGCNPSSAMITELPDILGDYPGLLDGKTITQFLVAALPAARMAGVCDAEFVGLDPRVDWTTGEIRPGQAVPLDLSLVFDIPPDTAYLRADTIGSPCLALIKGDANFSWIDLLPALPYGGAYAVSQFPEFVPGMFEFIPRFTEMLGPGQPDLRKVPQGSYQTEIREVLVDPFGGPYTREVVNPQRVRVPDWSYFMLNTRQTCLELDPSLPELEAVYRCHIDLALEYEANLRATLTRAAPFLLDPSIEQIERYTSQLQSMIKNEQWRKALRDINTFLNAVQAAQWQLEENPPYAPGEDVVNHLGLLIMLGENLRFRVEQLQEAEGYIFP